MSWFSIVSSNKNTWRKKDVLERYKIKDFLFPAEKKILALLRDKLSRMSVLDIGVGAGRTTGFLAGKTAKYIGFDYSPEMIELCKGKYAGQLDELQFLVMDARDLSAFADNTFDFTWFSYNGIDNLDETGRKSAFSEIHRVTKPGGYFSFSTLNLNYTEQLLSLDRKIFKKNVSEIIKYFIKYPILRLVNPSLNKIRKMNKQHIRNGSLKFRLKPHYIRPAYQVEKLAEMGFDRIRVFQISGDDVTASEFNRQNMDHWLFYLCQKK